MAQRREEEHEDGGQGMADLFINSFLVILIVMFVFMLNQGVKTISSQADEQLLAQLMESQQQAMDDAAAQANAVAGQQQIDREKALAEKRAMVAANKQTEAAGESREEILRGEIENLQEEMSKSRAAKSLRIDISHDSTGSMASVIENTKNTTATLTRLLPKLLREVEIGLIAYRDNQLSEIPILPVKHPKDDGGASITQLNTTLGQLQAIGGVANIEQSIRTSMLRMDAMPGSPRECLVVIGDVGTEEVSPGNPAVAEQLIADVKAWCERPGKNRRVLALYTGGSGDSPESFFQRLGSVNTESMFSTNPSQMFELILNAAFAPKELKP